MTTNSAEPSDNDPARPEYDRALGVAGIAIGVLVIVGAIIAAFLGWRLIGRAGESVAATLDVTRSVVQTIDDTIQVADLAVTEAGDGLDTIRVALIGTQETLTTAGLVLTDTATLVGTDIPDGLDSVRETMPALIQSAQLIDSALGALSFAGIDFSPDQPPQNSLADVDAGLADVSVQLRESSAGLDDFGSDFESMSADVGSVAADLDGIVETLSRTDTLLDQYRTTTAATATVVDETAAGVADQTSDARLLLVLILGVVALGQVLPIGAGVLMLRRDRSSDPIR